MDPLANEREDRSNVVVLGITTKTRRSTVCLLKKLPRFSRLIAARFSNLRDFDRSLVPSFFLLRGISGDRGIIDRVDLFRALSNVTRSKLIAATTFTIEKCCMADRAAC